MTSPLKYALITAGLMALAFPGQASADGTTPAFPYAATATIAGGFNSMSGSTFFGDGLLDNDIGLIVAGGDFVIPVTGYWNIQLGGQFRHETGYDYGFQDTTLFQGGGIGFWRDQAMGTIGIEAGLYTPQPTNSGSEETATYVKLGGVGEYYFSEMITAGAYGGMFIAPSPDNNGSRFADDGFYVGGNLNYYATDRFAFSAIGQFSEMNIGQSGTTGRHLQTLRAGGKLRYLTSMSGVELFAAGNYVNCDARREEINRESDGFEFLAGVNIRLGGESASLVSIDRSNALDTRVWTCYDEGIY